MWRRQHFWIMQTQILVPGLPGLGSLASGYLWHWSRPSLVPPCPQNNHNYKSEPGNYRPPSNELSRPQTLPPSLDVTEADHVFEALSATGWLCLGDDTWDNVSPDVTFNWSHADGYRLTCKHHTYVESQPETVTSPVSHQESGDLVIPEISWNVFSIHKRWDDVCLLLSRVLMMAAFYHFAKKLSPGIVKLKTHQHSAVPWVWLECFFLRNQKQWGPLIRRLNSKGKLDIVLIEYLFCVQW